MKTTVIRIGNSRGIRIPKTVLEQCGFKGPVELEVRDGQLVVRTTAKARAGWDDAFRGMHKHGDDALLDKGTLPGTKWDRTEWQW